MPVRSLGSPVLTWPDAEAVESSLRAWASGLLSQRADVLAVGFFGSYARGDWGVGSDLDVVVLVAEASEPALRRPLEYDTVTAFPVPVDLLVYTAEEWERLDDGSPFARRLREEIKWVAHRST